MTDYSEDFYQHQMAGSLRSAEVIVPIVLDLVSAESVADIGCGVGTWLSIYKKLGINDILGIDGDYVDHDSLLIDNHLFRAHDLSKPIEIDRKFDLVQSLEVAEHIDASNAEQFVSGLVQLSNIVLFSAAVPFQLGTGHVNEQFIDYWIDIFKDHNYHPVDFIRPLVWNNNLVEVCYRQNMLLFASPDTICRNPKLEEAHERTNPEQLSIIHPDLYQPRIHRLLNTLLDIARQVQSNGNLPLAQSIFTSILDFDPRNHKTWDSFGQLAAQANNLDIAVAYIKRAIELKPSEASYLYNLGQIYTAAGAPDKARNLYNTALKENPGDPKILDALAKLPK